jgi:hypothetical protein
MTRSGSSPSASPLAASPRAWQITRAGARPGRGTRVVVPAVQVAVQPQVGARDQVVVGVAEAGRAGLAAIARVGAAQAGREVRDHHGAIPAARRGCVSSASSQARSARPSSRTPSASKGWPPRGGHQAHEVAAARIARSRCRRRRGRSRSSARRRRSARAAIGGFEHGDSRCSSRMPSAAHSVRSAGTTCRRRGRRTRGCRARRSPAPASRQNRASPDQVASMSPASTSTSAPGAGSGSKASVSRCRSDSSCSFTPLQIVARSAN